MKAFKIKRKLKMTSYERFFSKICHYFSHWNRKEWIFSSIFLASSVDSVHYSFLSYKVTKATKIQRETYP